MNEHVNFAGWAIYLFFTCVVFMNPVLSCTPSEPVADGGGQPLRISPVSPPLTATLRFKQTRFKASEPIAVDVFLENHSKEDICRGRFSPESSNEGLPDFVIRNVSTGEELIIPPGLYSDEDEWDSWYVPDEGRESYSVDVYVIPARSKVHLLKGDLRDMLQKANEHCDRTLREDVLMTVPSNIHTKRSYENIVRKTRSILAGGTFDVYIEAHVLSAGTRITLDRAPAAPAS